MIMAPGDASAPRDPWRRIITGDPLDHGVDFVTMHTLLGHVHVHATVRS
jgi:hypothetical protein